MKFALLQFSISKNSLENYQKIKNAIFDASKNGAKILVTQECALSGYPPIEINSVEDVDFETQDNVLKEIINLAKEKDIFVILGLIRKENDSLKNSMVVLSPDGSAIFYDKRALWGWDKDNFESGTNKSGIFEIAGIKIGLRICFEIRFPEYFRELYKEKVDVAIVSFCDVNPEPDPVRLQLIKSHLLTRAIENAFTLVSVNSTTLNQTAPTCVVNPDGRILVEAKLNEESIIYYDHQKFEAGFGTQGRIHYSNRLVGILF